MSLNDMQLTAVLRAAMDEALRPIKAEIEAINTRLTEGGTRMQQLGNELAENTTTTGEVRDMFDTVKKGFKVLGWLGDAMKWLAIVSGAVATAYGLLKGWMKP